MKAALFHAYGGPEVLRVEQVPTPEPGPGEVRLRVRAAALNHLDLFVRRGLPHQLTLPHIGGSDAAGVIDAVGPDVGGWAAGERVIVNPSLTCGQCDACRRGADLECREYRILGEHVPGTFAEYIVVPAVNLLRVPGRIDDVRVAAAPLTFLTAWRGVITRGRVQAGESILVTGASGGTAIAAMRIALSKGARVFAITSTPFVERVRGLGVEHVFDRKDPNHRKELFNATGRRGVDMIFDSVGEATWMENIRALARSGRMVVYGATSGPEATTDVRYVFWKQIEILGTTMASRTEFETVMEKVFTGELEPVVDSVLPLDQVCRAHERLERGDAFGKIVLVP
jgi:NADPH:quinone reductase-like Zn-dependent oxidoreductase